MSSNGAILMVDDDPEILRGAGLRLRAAGYETYTASDADSGINAAVETHPDLILLDVRLPQRDGLSALSDLKHRPSTRDIPVVMLSSSIVDEQAAFDVNAQPDERTSSFFREVLGKTHQHTGRSIQQDDFCFFRMYRTKLVLERFSGDLGNRARQFHAGRTSTDDDEGKPCTAHLWIIDSLGDFECVQNLVSDRGRFFNALHARSPLFPVVVSEIGSL